MNDRVDAIVNARLQGKEGLYRLAIAGDRFAEITPQPGTVPGDDRTLDAAGNLVAPPFVEPHIHLDAALTAGEPRWNQSGTLFEGIECWAERKALLSRTTCSPGLSRPCDCSRTTAFSMSGPMSTSPIRI